jgi:hypothetical protein
MRPAAGPSAAGRRAGRSAERPAGLAGRRRAASCVGRSGGHARKVLASARGWPSGSASLAGMLAQLHSGLSARYPGDPRVAELADALT